MKTTSSSSRRTFFKSALAVGGGAFALPNVLPAMPRSSDPVPLKITKVEALRLDEYAYARIHTNAGIVGVGEAGAHRLPDGAAEVIRFYARYLEGQDPLRIQHHWEYMFRMSHFRGAVKMAAISAIDIALWDIAGKYFDVPVYKLLGGPTRNIARCYYWVRGSTKEELIQGCRDAKAAGFTAVGHLTPFLDYPREMEYFMTYADKMEDAVDTVRRYREAVGPDVDLCLEIHRRLNPAEAVVLGNAIEPYYPFFYEDPVPPHNFDSMAAVARKVNIPIATGERLHTSHEFAMLLRQDAVQYLRTSVSLCGGITSAVKIAALADAFDAQIVPHTPLSPVSTASCIQVAAAVPNFALQELPTGENEFPKRAIVEKPLEVVDGFFQVPTTPGIGIELAYDAVENVPAVPKEPVTQMHIDGSIVNH